MCLVVPKAWCILHGFIPVGGDFTDNFSEHDGADFFEAVHSTADLETYVTISFNVEVVFVYDFLWDHSVVHSYVLEI